MGAGQKHRRSSPGLSSGRPSTEGRCPVVKNDAEQNGHVFEQCYGYGNTLADNFMALCGQAMSMEVQNLRYAVAQANNWAIEDWK